MYYVIGISLNGVRKKLYQTTDLETALKELTLVRARYPAAFVSRIR